MRIKTQALVEGADGEAPRTETISTVERDAEGASASGLGLSLRETHALLRQLQAVVLREQASQFLDRAARCRQCGGRLATKDSKVVVYRTAFGKAQLNVPPSIIPSRRTVARHSRHPGHPGHPGQLHRSFGSPP